MVLVWEKFIATPSPFESVDKIIWCYIVAFNSLIPISHIKILHADIHTLLKELVERICLEIKVFPFR